MEIAILVLLILILLVAIIILVTILAVGTVVIRIIEAFDKLTKSATEPTKGEKPWYSH